jgi:hypothetical protein
VQNSQIIVITPSLPPSIGGVEDYSSLLALQMQQYYQVQSHFIISNSQWIPSNKDTSQVVVITARNAKSLLINLENSKIKTVLLHYVGYGYAKRGSPNWLINGLAEWKKKDNSRKLVAMFHEIYASGGSIWQSQFWTGSWQRYLATRLIKLSDVCLTSRNDYAQKITQMSNGRHLQVLSLPVFSNIGEPTDLPNLASRNKQMVIFGGLGARIRVYKDSISTLIRICKTLSLTQIIDIGNPIPFALPNLEGINLISMGVLAPAQISEIFLNSQVGFLNYPPDYFAKSTIFAAFASHKLLAIAEGNQTMANDGLISGKHFWCSDRDCEQLTIEKGEAIAEQAHQWYQAHNLKKQGNIYFKSLEKL